METKMNVQDDMDNKSSGEKWLYSWETNVYTIGHGEIHA